jgi:hypothetical protein
VWRVTAHYVQADWPRKGETHEWTTVKHYHTEAAARHRAAVVRGVVEPVNPEMRRFYPPAQSVVIERSAPVDGWTVTS